MARILLPLVEITYILKSSPGMMITVAPTPNHTRPHSKLTQRSYGGQACNIPVYPDVEISHIKRNQVVNLKCHTINHIISYCKANPLFYND